MVPYMISYILYYALEWTPELTLFSNISSGNDIINIEVISGRNSVRKPVVYENSNRKPVFDGK